MPRMLPVLALMATLSVPGLAADTVAPAGDRPEPQADTPVARVNGVAIPALYMDFVRQSRIARNLPAEALTPDALRDGLVASELLVQEATRKGLDKEPSVAAALEFQRRELLAKAAVEDFVRKNPVSEADMKAEYDQAKAKTGDREYRVSHILVSTEREARDILAQLKKPKVKFETLAKKIFQGQLRRQWRRHRLDRARQSGAGIRPGHDAAEEGGNGDQPRQDPVWLACPAPDGHPHPGFSGLRVHQGTHRQPAAAAGHTPPRPGPARGSPGGMSPIRPEDHLPASGMAGGTDA